MRPADGRYEEFGAPAWAGALLAILLMIAIGGHFAHPAAAAPARAHAAQVAAPHAGRPR